MSKIEEMSAKYADERLSLLRPDISDSSYSRHTKMTFDLFDGYELESAFEEGAEAVLEEIEKIIDTSKLYSDMSTKTRLYEDLVNKINELKML